MRYRCVSCKEEFEVPDGDRARCPSCLRIHDVEPVERSRPRATSRYRGVAIVGVVVALAVGGYVAWYLSQDEGDDDDTPAAVEVGPLDDDDLREALERRQAKGSEIVMPFEASKEVVAFARKAGRGAASDQEKVQALHDAIRELVTNDHEPFVASSPRHEEVRSPGRTLASLESDESFEPYPYELAALMVACLRSLDVGAVLAEVYDFEGEERPADASGIFGHFAVAVPSGSSYDRAVLWDPSSGRNGESAAGDHEVLTDVEAVGVLLTHRALHSVGYGTESSEAERLASVGVRLRPRSATAMAARGTVRLLAGGGELSARAALEEYERALGARNDPQRKLLVARVLLAAREIQRAEQLVRSALEEAPEFGAAHGLMGMIHAGHGRIEEAQAAITRAERLEPRDPHIGLLWVQLHIAQQDLTAAADAAQAVVDRVPDDPQPRLMLAQVLWEDARYELAQSHLRELIRRNPENDQLRDAIRQLFEYDPTAAELREDGGPTEVASSLSDDADGGTSADGGYSADGGTEAPRLQMGKGLGKIRLGGSGGFQLSMPGGGM